MSYHDHIADFISFMAANGVEPIEPIAQRLAGGSLIRFRCEGDGKGRQNGWAILYLDERPAGAFGNYRMNTGTLKWKANSDRPALSKAEREALQREWREKKAEREAERADAARQASLDAADMWQRAKSASSEHAYVARKMLDPALLRQIDSTLLVPMFDASGILWNLQRINPDGEKRFLQGGRTEDLFCLIGELDGPPIICEGYATGDSIRQATGLPVIVAFSSANLVRVARLWSNARPDLEFTIFADDDAATEAKTGSNVGIEAAEAAAAECGMRVAYPSSYRERQEGRAA